MVVSRSHVPRTTATGHWRTRPPPPAPQRTPPQPRAPAEPRRDLEQPCAREGGAGQVPAAQRLPQRTAGVAERRLLQEVGDPQPEVVGQSQDGDAAVAVLPPPLQHRVVPAHGRVAHALVPDGHGGAERARDHKRQRPLSVGLTARGSQAREWPEERGRDARLLPEIHRGGRVPHRTRDCGDGHEGQRDHAEPPPPSVRGPRLARRPAFGVPVADVEGYIVPLTQRQRERLRDHRCGLERSVWRQDCKHHEIRASRAPANTAHPLIKCGGHLEEGVYRGHDALRRAAASLVGLAGLRSILGSPPPPPALCLFGLMCLIGAFLG